MKLLDVWREADHTMKAEEEDELEVPRLRVLRAMGLAAVAVVAVVFLGMATTTPSDRFIWVCVGLLLLWAVAGVGLWATHH